MELAGRLVLALEGGATVVFCYNARLSEAEERCLPEIVPGAVSMKLGGQVHALSSHPPPHPGFREYLIQHGHSDQGFVLVNATDVEVLGHNRGSGGGKPVPAAFVSRAHGRGRLYVVPLHVASGIREPFRLLLGSVLQHRDASSDVMPDFLQSLELPGEGTQREKRAELARRIAKVDESLAQMVTHKMLLSHLSDTPFEHLVIEELNFVLDGSSLANRTQSTANQRVFAWSRRSRREHLIPRNHAALRRSRARSTARLWIR
jgi:hypothetical protein